MVEIFPVLAILGRCENFVSQCIRCASKNYTKMVNVTFKFLTSSDNLEPHDYCCAKMVPSTTPLDLPMGNINKMSYKIINK